MVARFLNVPFSGSSTFATVGLSDNPLKLLDGRLIRQELIFSVHDVYPADAVASFLLTFSEFVRSQSRALARGDVIGPSASLIPDVAASAVYTCPPVIFPTGLDFYTESSPPTIVVWLVPLVGGEAVAAKKISNNGFEDIFEDKNPDLLDLNRVALV